MRIPSLHTLVDTVRAIGQQRVVKAVLETAKQPRRVSPPVTEARDTSKDQDSDRNN